MNDGQGMTEERANRVYDVLVRLAGARDDDDDRLMFVHIQTREWCTEYRFMGSLGFGGKFWRTPDGFGERWRIDCYREDETPGRRRIIDETNEALEQLLAETKNP